MKHRIQLLTVAALLWLSCSFDITGGSGTETTDSFVCLASGAPAANSRILLIDQANWLHNVLSGDYIIDSVTASKNGRFSFRNTDSYRGKQLSIQIDHDSAGLCRRNIHPDNLDSATFVLSSYSEINGTISNARSGTALRIDGTAYRTTVNADGSFSFKQLAPGNWAVIAEDAAGLHSAGTVPVSADTVIDAALNGNWNGRFLLTDFECGFTAPLAEASGITPFWYLFSDSTGKNYDDETGQWVTDIADDFIKAGNSFIDANVKIAESGGQRLFIDGRLDQNSSYPYIGIGAALYTEGNNGINLQDAAAVQFDVSGTGTLKLIFIAKHPQHKSSVRFLSTIPLTSENVNVSIDVASLEINQQTEDSLKVSWAEASGHVRNMEFAFYYSDNTDASIVTAAIDNIVFKGKDIKSIRMSE